MIELSLDVKFSTRQYKSFLNRLKKLGLLIATVGIHANEGKQKVIRRYTSFSKGKTHIAGKSHRMTIAKLAYQNEFGANIRIKPKYKTKTENKTTVYNSARHRITETISRRYSSFAKQKEQGYLLLDKSGNFVAYFRPTKVIKIPERSFLRKTVKDIDPKIHNIVSNILQDVLVNKTLTPNQAMNKISKLIQYKVKNNMKNTSPNHPLTFKAKGHKSPLVDEQDRLSKAIKYKIYKNPYRIGTSGNVAYLKQFEKFIDKTLKSAKMYEKIAEQITTKQKIFSYRRLNPNRSEYLK